MNGKTFQVMVFGKTGCEKCKVLNKRLDDLLVRPEWADFEKTYCDVETEDGLVQFCRTECVNPNRIPAVVVARWNAENSRHERIGNAHPETADPVLKKSKLYTYLGLQTDYSVTGQGLITPKMLTSLLEEARQTAASV